MVSVGHTAFQSSDPQGFGIAVRGPCGRGGDGGIGSVSCLFGAGGGYPVGVVMDHVLAGNGDAHAVRRGSVPLENITGNERYDRLHVAQAGLVQGLSQNLGAVVLGVHFGNDLLDLALFVNHKGDTVGPHV